MLSGNPSKQPILDPVLRDRRALREALAALPSLLRPVGRRGLDPADTGGLIPRATWHAWILCGLLLACSGCGRDEPSPQPQGLEVVATYSILGDLVRQVGGDRVGVRTLVGLDSDAHTYEPTPKDSVALHDARLVFENGLGFESWLDDLFAASGSSADRVVVTRSIEARAIESHEASTDPHDHGVGDPAGHGDHVESGDSHTDHDEQAHGHHHGALDPDEQAHGHGHGEQAHGHDHGEQAHDHDHGDFDPHVWHAVPNAIAMVAAVADALAAADPANATAYRAHRDRYVGELRELDAWVRSQVQAIPEEQRILVTSHDTFGYFAEQYGFRTVTVLGSISSEIADPSAAAVADVVEQIQATGVTAVFAENMLNPRLTEQIARQSNVRVVATLYTDALGAADSEGATYIAMIRHNVQTIVEALR